MIDPTKLKELATQARARVNKAKDSANIAVNGRAPEHVQLGTWNVVKQRPDLQEKIKKERGESGWSEYQSAMTALENKFNGGTGV